MWFKVKEAKNFLLKHHIVCTLRPFRRKRDFKNPHGYYENLVDDQKQNIGLGYVFFIKEIKDDSEVTPFLRCSGFDIVQQWLYEAKYKYAKTPERLFLYVVFLQS